MTSRPYNSAPLAVFRRASKHPTLDALAEAVETSPVVLSGIERGSRSASEALLKSVAKALGQPYAAVLKMHLEARHRYLTEEARRVRAQIGESA